MTSQSQCICGHRLCYHDSGSRASDFRLDSSLAVGFQSGCTKHQGLKPCRCKKCPCKKFFFIMSEGSWVLRCRCKHKHTEHDPNTRKCKKVNCKCSCFQSPWVCNCDHAWVEHDHKLVTREVKAFSSEQAMEAAKMHAAIQDINNYDELKRGAEHNMRPL